MLVIQNCGQEKNQQTTIKIYNYIMGRKRKKFGKEKSKVRRRINKEYAKQRKGKGKQG